MNVSNVSNWTLDLVEQFYEPGKRKERALEVEEHPLVDLSQFEDYDGGTLLAFL